MATVYSDRGHGMRAPAVFYNRANEAGALLKPGDFDWQAIFSGGVRWFHSGGIFAALSPTTSEVIIEGMQAAKEAGAVVSFDLNYRAKLWSISGGEERAAAVLDRIVKNADVLVGNEEDLQKGNHHSWSAVAWISGQTYQAPTTELDVFDRVGGGDRFASGFFYGMLTNEPPEECVKLGWAHGALLTTFPGDTTMATVEQVRAFAKGGSARIQR
jgi:2-dehydro-3-deoxygluconokinase